jgi:hypothetical protein
MNKKNNNFYVKRSYHKFICYIFWSETLMAELGERAKAMILVLWALQAQTIGSLRFKM